MVIEYAYNSRYNDWDNLFESKNGTKSKGKGIYRNKGVIKRRQEDRIVTAKVRQK